MPDIKSPDQWMAAAKQQVTIRRTTARTAVAQGWFSVFDLAGEPGAGALAGVNTANGVVPTDAVAGYPVIDAFGASAIGRVSFVEFSASVAGRFRLFDRLFVTGAHAFNANLSLSAQPSYASRVTLRNPANDADSVDYKGLELWVEQVTAATGNQAVAATYVNEIGTTGRAAPATGIAAAPTVGRCWQLPLQAGDKGVQQIQNLQGTVATAGTFNLQVLRPLGTYRVKFAGDGDTYDMFKTGLRQVFSDSALYVLFCPDSTSTGVIDLELQISNA